MTDRFVVPRVRDLPASPTIAVAKEAQALRRQGVDVVDFGVGEPDFDTPAHVREEAVRALHAGLTHYAPGRGLPQLLEAIAAKLERENGLRYDPATEIVVTPGAKQAIVEAILTAVAPGDEVIVFDPSWGSYEAIVLLAGGSPIHVQLRQDFTIDPDRLHAALSARTRAIIVGSPSNPTGHVLTAVELDLLARVCREWDLLLVSDEIYERITYGGCRAVSPATLPGMWERTVTINGFSKAYAMTGWRLGYLAAPESFMRQVLKVHEHTVTTATSFAQAGGIVALNGPQEPIRAMVGEFASRRDLIVAGLNELPGVRCLPPEGAFYVFPDVSATGRTGSELAHLLLRHGVALTPGRGFGERWDTHVRLSYATSAERIRAGLERMASALAGVEARR
ncbi:MAG: pyridoxal phosphate-dependent aminotransferase [Chloroflexi bacterium]|nr:pyridoxal phosphate-dependent aminotransferase [Chloroflexota bacterium]